MCCELQGFEASTFARSTLHALFDIAGAIVSSSAHLFLEDAAYPILKWFAGSVSAHGALISSFNHHDYSSFESALQQTLCDGKQPIILCDSICSGCWQIAPLRRYIDVLQDSEGILIVDDTHAFGILGHEPDNTCPYGYGGGGVGQWIGLTTPRLVTVASLAKAFGVPIAAISGSSGIIQKIESSGGARLHCSPPSIVDFDMAEAAFQQNQQIGDVRRAALYSRVVEFREGIGQIGITSLGGFLPAQYLRFGASTRYIHAKLLSDGYHTLLVGTETSSGEAIVVLIRSDHSSEDLDGLTQALDNAICSAGAQPL